MKVRINYAGAVPGIYESMDALDRYIQPMGRCPRYAGPVLPPFLRR